MPDVPVADIVLPVKLPAPWLQDCIKSIERIQSPDFNLIISIHGSSLTNETENAQIRNFSIVSSPASATLSDVLNAGITEGTSPFVVRIDADDLMCQERVRLQISILEADPQLVGVGSDAVVIDENGMGVGYRKGSGNREQTLRKLAWRNPLIHPSMTFRRSTFDHVGGYNPKAFLAEDYDLWLRMASIGDLMSISKPLIQYRIHTQQTSRRGLVSKQARSHVRRSQLNLAQARGKNAFLADLRGSTWSAHHTIRRLGL